MKMKKIWVINKNNMIKFLEFFNNPLIIISIVIVFFIAFMVYLETSRELTSKFWSFGPVLNDKGEYFQYMTFRLDSWTKVIYVYVIIFLTAIVNTLYSRFYKTKFKSHLESKDYSIMSRIVTFMVLGINPLVDIVSYIVNFFAVACFQFQYLLPLFLGEYLVEIPYIASLLVQKI